MTLGHMGELERAIGRCPVAREGEWLAVLERWAPGADGGVLYEAASTTEAQWRAARWRAASEMPHGAARWFVEVYRVQAIRLHALNAIQIVGAGVRCPAHDSPSSYCQSECEVRRAAFAARWDHAYSDRARVWRANPWIWALSVRRADAAAMQRARASVAS